MKIYVASRFKNRDLVKSFVAKVLTMRPKKELVVRFTQTWPDEPVLDGLSYYDAQRIAYRDIMEIDEADTLVVLTEQCELVPGGMHFETGYAWARGHRIIVIGPRVNVFQSIGGIEWYPTVAAFLEDHFEEVL
jgi:nucleoside 2-deoxyribosyltransferase